MPNEPHKQPYLLKRDVLTHADLSIGGGGGGREGQGEGDGRYLEIALVRDGSEGGGGADAERAAEAARR